MSEAPEISAEKVVWSGSISHWHYAGRWLFAVFLLALAVGSFFWTPDFLGPPRSAEANLWIARGVLAALALLVMGSISLSRSRRKYKITTRRVSVEFGIVDKQSNEVRVQDIRSINLLCRGISGMFGIGRVEFASAAADDAEVVFWSVGGAEKIRDMVRSLQA